METRNAIRSVVKNIPGIWQLKPEQEEFFNLKFKLSTATDRQQETGQAKVRQGDNCDCVPPWLPSWTIRLRRAAKLSLCAAQLGVHNDREIMEWNFSLMFFVAPYPGFSIQNGELCWHQPYTKTTLSSMSLTRHMLHTNGEFAYTGLVINFNKLICFDISSVRGGWAGA